MRLQEGKFYRSKGGEVWCCFQVDERKEEHCQAYCVRVTGSGLPSNRIEYFFLDGRYDRDGLREYTLVEEVPKGSCSLTDLRNEALRIANEHGFKDASIPEDIALMHSELSEALEDFREGRLAHEMEYEDAGGTRFKTKEDATRLSHHIASARGFKPVGIPSEMADVVIRVLHFCGKHGIDIEKAVEEKMAYNATRPFKHGGKKI